jgi:hypothetical protein
LKFLKDLNDFNDLKDFIKTKKTNEIAFFKLKAKSEKLKKLLAFIYNTKMQKTI